MSGFVLAPRRSALARAAGRSFPDGGSEVLDSVPALLLGGVKAGIGLIQQRFQFVLPIASRNRDSHAHGDESLHAGTQHGCAGNDLTQLDRKSTRLNSSHLGISYA